MELQARLSAAGADAMSLAAHPGFASTEIGATRSGDAERGHDTRAGAAGGLVPSAADAARPSLRAATSPDAYGGQYYGPGGLGAIKGAPIALPVPRR